MGVILMSLGRNTRHEGLNCSLVMFSTVGGFPDSMGAIFNSLIEGAEGGRPHSRVKFQPL